MSFDELQELLFLSLDDGTIDDGELLLSYEEFRQKNPELLYEIMEGWKLKTWITPNVWLSLELRKETYQFLLKHSKYRTASHAINEVLWATWKASVSCLED